MNTGKIVLVTGVAAFGLFQLGRLLWKRSRRGLLQEREEPTEMEGAEEVVENMEGEEISEVDPLVAPSECEEETLHDVEPEVPSIIQPVVPAQEPDPPVNAGVGHQHHIFKPPGISVVPTQQEVENMNIRQARSRVHSALLLDSHKNNLQGGAGDLAAVFIPPGTAAAVQDRRAVLNPWDRYIGSLKERGIILSPQRN